MTITVMVILAIAFEHSRMQKRARSAMNGYRIINSKTRGRGRRVGGGKRASADSLAMKYG